VALELRSEAAPRLATYAAPAGDPDVEPALRIEDVCKLRNVSRRCGERERSASRWPEPDFFIGAGRRPSPRWRRATIEKWLTAGGHPPLSDRTEGKGKKGGGPRAPR
jgi:hypothetical protein